MSKEKPRIEPTRNGPYKVANLENFKNSRGRDIEGHPVMFLCRCGHSKNKPFCSGQHGYIKFKDEKN